MFEEILERLSKIRDNVHSNEYCRSPRYIDTDFDQVTELIEEVHQLVKDSEGGINGL